MKKGGRHLSGSFSLRSRKSSPGFSQLHQHNLTVFTKGGTARRASVLPLSPVPAYALMAFTPEKS